MAFVWLAAAFLEPSSRVEHRAVPIHSSDGATSELLVTTAPDAKIGLLWIPALGVPARHYEGFAAILARRGIAVARHEWRGIGSSSLRASRENDWGYRELLDDVADSLVAAQASAPELRWLVGGHSLGAQFAAMAFALQRDAVDGLIVVAGGTPNWKNFAGLGRIGLRVVFSVAPAIARWRGYFPGRRFRFGGNEAHGVMRDWAQTGRSGRYAVIDVNLDIEAALSRRRGPVLGVWLDEDWFTPRRSFDHLLGKLASASTTLVVLSRNDFNGNAADHFGWIKWSDPVVAAIVEWTASNLHRTTESA